MKAEIQKLEREYVTKHAINDYAFLMMIVMEIAYWKI